MHEMSTVSQDTVFKKTKIYRDTLFCHAFFNRITIECFRRQLKCIKKSISVYFCFLEDSILRYCTYLMHFLRKKRKILCSSIIKTHDRRSLQFWKSGIRWRTYKQPKINRNLKKTVSRDTVFCHSPAVLVSKAHLI